MTPDAKALSRLLDIEVPILQAPTGSIASPELAAAVSNAGGLGALGLTWMREEQALAAIAEVRSLTNRPFLVNFALAFEPRALQAVLAARVPVVSFSWGLDSAAIHQVTLAGSLCLVQVGSPQGALAAVAAGADAVILQGVEAGGHVQSTTSVRVLLAQTRAAGLAVPLIAAGGIASGKDVRRALLLGAAGAMLGTRFVATAESAAHRDYKARLLQAKASDCVLTVCFDGGWPHAPHRVLRNETLMRWEAAGCPPPGSRPGEGDLVARTSDGAPIYRYEDTAPRLGMTGEVGDLALYSGTGVGRIRNIPSAGELVRQLWSEAADLAMTRLVRVPARE